MGDPSYLRLIPASSAATPIDWSRVPETTKKYLIKQYGYDQDKKEYKPLSATIGDLAKMFDNTKFLGYFRSNILEVFMDISEFGLTPLGQTQISPRFYMTYLERVWFVLFAPGTRECIIGYSEEIIRNMIVAYDDDKAWEKLAADEAAIETAMAQAFDIKLEQEVSQGMGTVVEFTQTLGGWSAWTLPAHYLEYPVHCEAMFHRYQTWYRH